MTTCFKSLVMIKDDHIFPNDRMPTWRHPSPYHLENSLSASTFQEPAEKCSKGFSHLAVISKVLNDWPNRTPPGDLERFWMIFQNLLEEHPPNWPHPLPKLSYNTCWPAAMDSSATTPKPFGRSMSTILQRLSKPSGGLLLRHKVLEVASCPGAKNGDILELNHAKPCGRC